MTDITQEEMLIQDINKDILLISEDINDHAILSEPHYQELIAAIRSRQSVDQHAQLKLLSLPEEIENIDSLSHHFDLTGVEDVSFISSLWTNIARLFSYQQLNRKLTLNEKLLIGICVVAILLSITSFIIALPFAAIAGLSSIGIILGAVAFAKAVLSLTKIFQTYRVNKSELERTYPDAAKIKVDIELLREQIDIETNTATNKNSSNLIALLHNLRLKTDEYILIGHRINQLKHKVSKPSQQIHRGIQISASITALIGAVLLFFPPLIPIGGVIMAIGGIVGVGSTLNNWRLRSKESRRLSPKDAKDIREGRRAPKTANEQRYAEILKEHGMANTQQTAKPMKTPTTPDASINDGDHSKEPVVTQNPVYSHTDMSEKHKAVESDDVSEGEKEGPDSHPV